MKKAGLYIHIPFCKTKCIYCDFYSITERENQIPEFTNAILKKLIHTSIIKMNGNLILCFLEAVHHLTSSRIFRKNI